MADTFEAISRDPQALKDTIARTPATLDEGTRSAAAGALRSCTCGRALRRGPGHGARAAGQACRRSTARSPPARGCSIARPSSPTTCRGTLRAVRDLARSPSTDTTLAGLTDTMEDAPTRRCATSGRRSRCATTSRTCGRSSRTTCPRRTRRATPSACRSSPRAACPDELDAELRRGPAGRGRPDRPRREGGVRRRRRAASVRLRPAPSDEHGQRRLRESGQRGLSGVTGFYTDHRTPGDQGPTFRVSAGPDGRVVLRRADRVSLPRRRRRPRTRGPSSFAVGDDAARARRRRRVPLVRQGRPVRQRALRDQGRVPRHGRHPTALAGADRGRPGRRG